VSCLYTGGSTGAFHKPTGRLWRWRVEVESPAGLPCFTRVFARDRAGGKPVPTRPLVAKYGRIQMRSTQMAGHSVFDVRVSGTGCRAVVTNSVFGPLTRVPVVPTTKVGDLGPFASIETHPPYTVRAHGTCTTEVRDDDDGRLLQRKSGSSYTMTVSDDGFWISNTPGCAVSVI
jgi:hypothetical protein